VSRVWLRATALALAAIGAVAGLTVYYSSDKVPRCLVSGVDTWRPPADGGTHRYEVVLLNGSACVFDTTQKHRLVGALSLAQAKWLAKAAPTASDTLRVEDREHGVVYETKRGLLGVRVLDLRTKQQLYVARFKGFTWNPRFGPDPPTHGLSLAPDRPELWVLDAPNHALHVFDVSAVPASEPRRVDDVRLERTLTRPGSLTRSADGRFLYVGDAGDVIDTETRKSVANLDALQQASVVLQVDWVDGRPVFPGFPS